MVQIQRIVANKKIKFVRTALWDCQKVAAPYLDRYVHK